MAQRAGRMHVLLTLHGGEEALSDVLEGLVARNVRAIRSRKLPRLKEARLVMDGSPVWRDAVSAAADGIASPGTLAAWAAAEQCVKNVPARVALVGGVPQLALRVGGTARFPAYRFTATYGDPSAKSVIGNVPERTQGRVQTTMTLTLDDDEARPVREIGDAIARHNAKRIMSQGLPELYKTGVRYQTEGTPEKWWDAEEILAQGHDDCEGLAAFRAGELITRGYDAHVHTRLITGPADGMGGGGASRLFHAITRVDGLRGGPRYDDPSVRLGMPVPTWYRKYAETRRAAGKPL